MRQTRAFFVPDYYERFICKADTCRANCCHGWCITVSMQDYFNLLSVPCSKRLRDKLDVSLRVVKNADRSAMRRFCQTGKETALCSRRMGFAVCRLNVGNRCFLQLAGISVKEGFNYERLYRRI